MSSPAAPSPAEPSKSFIAAWVATLLLIVVFVFGLLMFPPLFEEPKAEPTKNMLFIGRFHPVIVHLPIGSLVLLLLAEIACIRRAVEEKYGMVALIALWIGAAGAVFGVLAGILLSREGGYGGGNFVLHQGMGIAATAGILLALVLRIVAMSSQSGHGLDLYRVVFFVSFFFLGVGAHFGGNISHGSKFLVEHAPDFVARPMIAFEHWLLSFVEKKKDKDKADDKAIADARERESKEPPPPKMHADPVPLPVAPPVTGDKKPEPVVAKTPEPKAMPPAPVPGADSKSSAPPAPAPSSTPPPAGGTASFASADPSKTVWEHLILPVLEQKCNKCHNADKSKGDLRMDTHELLLKGGEAEPGKTVVPSKPAESLFIVRVELPLDDDEHMPPEGKDQMTKEELELVRWWINEGANNTMKVKDAQFPAQIKPLVEQLLGSPGASNDLPMQRPFLRSAVTLLAALALSASAAEPAAQDPAIKAATEAVAKSGASLLPVSADAKAFRFTALNVAKDFSDAGLAPLAPIADKIASLDLARTKVTDAGLGGVAAMKNLKELHLENTAIGDAALDHLKGLAELEYLNLYNTKVTDAGLRKLAGLAKLKSLYLWQSGVTKAGVAALRAILPKTHINTGWNAEDEAKPVAVAAAPAPAAAAPAKPAAAPAGKPAAPAPAAAAPAAPAAKLDPAVAAKAVIYKDVIAPIMAAKCTSCHGTEKKKGKLQLHDFASILKGGGEGAGNVVAGKPKDSLMMQRILLPKDDDEHMPPADEPQITKEECQILSWWIEQGASETLTVAAAKKTPAVEAALAVLLKGGLKTVAAAPGKAQKAKAAPLTDAEKKQVAEIATKMTALNASLMPLAQDTEQLRLSVINAADKFGDKELALLEPVAKHVLWVDLARSQVTDAGCDILAKMTNLERLHLENTKVTDAGLAKLAGLQSLEYLNLYGNKVTDTGVAKLETAKALKKVFVWQTGVTTAAAKALEGKVAGLNVNVGLSEAEIAKLTAPPPAPPAPPPAPAKKDDKKAGAPPAPPAAKPAAGPGSEVIKTAMKDFHKGDTALCKKVSNGQASDAELANLLKSYQAMCAATPPKGEKTAWVTKCQALIGSVKKIQAKDPAGVAAYKTAVNCKACHNEHKNS